MGHFSKTDYWLWSLTTLYTGIIYATIHLASKWRKFLTEKYGYDVFDSIYWLFAAIGIFLIFYLYKKNKNTSYLNLFKAYTSLLLISLIYTYYLYNLKYAVEKIHFLQYGLLGALLFIAFHRHIKLSSSAICALCVTYWLGLGDEFIQHLLSSRVGEIKDSLINAISGGLGIALVITVFSDSKANLKPHSKLPLPPFLIATTLLNALFIIEVHGFGYQHTHVDAGIMYSSLSPQELKDYNAGKQLSPYKNSAYEDEANRHLLQREYYCSNDFMNKKGAFYRFWDKCYMENQILKTHYPRYLKDKAAEDVYDIIAKYDKELAVKVKGNPVQWTQETLSSMEWAKPKESIFTSRVKSILITQFKSSDLWFYTVLVLFLILGTQYKISRKIQE